jgi:hypothetical protein
MFESQIRRISSFLSSLSLSFHENEKAARLVPPKRFCLLPQRTTTRGKFWRKKKGPEQTLKRE